MSLADQTCVPCRGGVPPLELQKIQELLSQLDTGWTLNPQGHIEKTYTFDNFADALAFTNRVGNVAELENHHPDIIFGLGEMQSGNLDPQNSWPHRKRFLLSSQG